MKRRARLYFQRPDAKQLKIRYYAHVYQRQLERRRNQAARSGNATHNVTMADSNKLFVDNSFRASTRPTADLTMCWATCVYVEQTDVTR